MFEYRQTAQKTARGSRPDAGSESAWYLYKNTPHLRLTYQIRLLTFLAGEHGTRLVVVTPAGCRLSADLSRFARENAATLTVSESA